MKYYKCELHTHTLWSDGIMTPEELVANAVKRGYAGIATTDHNTKFAYPRIKAAGDKAGITVTEGMEWTTFYGHITVLGGKSPVDWREVNPDNVNAMIERAKAAGDAVVLCHPTRIGGAICCGCHNDFDALDYGGLSGIEVWSHFNQNRDAANRQAETLWKERLDAGERIAAVYGYDWHCPDEGCPPYSATYLGAEGELTARKMVEAVKAGRTYISSGVELEISLTAGGRKYELSEVITENEVELSVKAVLNPDYAKEYDVEINAITVTGSALDIKADGSELYYSGKTDKGYFYIKVSGRINGENTELALTSPYYTEV